MVNDLDQAEETSTAGNWTSQRTGGWVGMLTAVAIAAGLGFLGGMLIGRKQGEARGLAIGLELGRREASAAIVAPRTWRRFWRREAAA